MTTEKKLNWENLEDGKCPKCGKKLELNKDEGVYECTSFDCVFTISERRALEIQEDLEDREYDEGPDYEW